MTPEERRRRLEFLAEYCEHLAIHAVNDVVDNRAFYREHGETLREALSLLDRAREVLTDLEWRGFDEFSGTVCLLCGQVVDRPHYPGCKLSALLADLGPAPKEGA